jgi:TetR/AcrR family transcriptional regulator
MPLPMGGLDCLCSQGYITNQSVINFPMSLSKLIGGRGASDEAQSGRRERRKEARPGELLDAALDLFVEKGFAATRAEEVAARAGVSKGTLFLYFPSKEELLKAVVRENISGRFKEWNEEFAAFEGTTAEMVRYCMNVWWERVGSTKASGITKLMMSEARNFPEIAAFYQEEVVIPAQTLIRRMLQRGVDSGEFRPLDIDYAVYTVVAPMIFLVMSKHSMGACVPMGTQLDPQRYLTMMADAVLGGLCAPANGAK